MKRELIFASLMVEYAIKHGFSLIELHEYFSERASEMNIDWDGNCNQGLDIIDILYSHLRGRGIYDFNEYPFV